MSKGVRSQRRETGAKIDCLPMSRTSAWSCLAALLLLPSYAPAQIDPGGVVNAASFMPQGFSGSGIARGSVFTVFGENLATEGLNQAQKFPLEYQMGGTSIDVTVGSFRSQCPLIYTTPTQVAALLPSTTPTGLAVLRLRGPNGVFPQFFTVVDRGFGLFTQNSGGFGPASAQNVVGAERPLNALNQALQPGQVVTLWGTGLGPVAFDETQPPKPTNFLNGLEVRIGNKKADQVLYAGRSSCCSGVDQINVVVPEGVEGCAVPVTAIVDGIPSNFASLAISADSTTCQDPYWLSREDIDTLAASDSTSIGEFVFGTVLFASQTVSAFSDRVATRFISRPTSAFLSTPQLNLVPQGYCKVETFIEARPALQVPSGSTILDFGGQLTISGPNGMRMLTLAGPGENQPDPILPNQPFFGPGLHSFTIAGGPDVGPSAFSVSVSQQDLTWAAPAVIRRDVPFRLTWTNPGEGEAITLRGQSSAVNSSGVLVSAAFECSAPASAGAITVPVDILRRLPPSAILDGGGYLGELSLTRIGPLRHFEATGLDLGIAHYSLRQLVRGIRYAPLQ